MPVRLSRLSMALHARRRRLGCRPPVMAQNDNAGWMSMAEDAPGEGPGGGGGEDSGEAEWEAPEPVWQGPGILLPLGVQNGRHRLGSVRALVPLAETADAESAETIPLRLLAYYGLWLGFEGLAEVAPGSPALPPCPRPRQSGGRLEYRLDLRRIIRGSQVLIADLTILHEGGAILSCENLSVVFRRQRGGGTAPAALKA